MNQTPISYRRMNKKNHTVHMIFDLVTYHVYKMKNTVKNSHTNSRKRLVPRKKTRFEKNESLHRNDNYG